MNSKERSFEMAKRLKELREEKHKSHAGLAAEIENKYGIKISRDSLINYEIATDNRTRSQDSPNLKMKVEYLIAFADYYGVSTDYLLCNTDIKTPDIELKNVCEYTGLSDSAATNLHKLANEEDEKGNDIISFLFQFLHNFLVFEDLTSFRNNALLSALTSTVERKAIYHSQEACISSSAPIETHSEIDRLIDEINGTKEPCGTVEVSAKIAASLYKQRAKKSIDSAFDDALSCLERSIECKYHIDEYIKDQVRSSWEQEGFTFTK